METSQQQNKIVFRVLKGQIALKIVFVFSFLLLVGCKTSDVKTQYNNDDYVIVHNILESIKNKHTDKVVVFNPSNNNEYLISLITDFKDCDEVQNNSKCDDLKVNLGKIDDSYSKAIFNKKEYDFLISQKEKNIWDIKKIGGIDGVVFEQNNINNNKSEVFISKPIYTVDKNFSLTYVNQKTKDYIEVYMKNKGNKWVEYKLIFPRVISPKIEYKS